MLRRLAGHGNGFFELRIRTARILEVLKYIPQQLLKCA
jgi:hypothetical protein